MRVQIPSGPLRPVPLHEVKPDGTHTGKPSRAERRQSRGYSKPRPKARRTLHSQTHTTPNAVATGMSATDVPMHLTLKSLDTEPIERVEEGDARVRYKNLKLLSPGVWSDAGSQTATYYPPDGIANLEAHYDADRYDGPPVNIMHDLDMDSFEAHEPSVAGHVDPETLDTDDAGNLFADVVFDTSTGAGQFADENLQSTLENEGTVGFGGPSVEIPAEGLEQEHDPQRDMPRVDGGRLTGVALVMDPASKSVNFAREAARRPVAMAASGKDAKALTHESEDMSATTERTLQDDLAEMLDQWATIWADLSGGDADPDQIDLQNLYAMAASQIPDVGAAEVADAFPREDFENGMSAADARERLSDMFDVEMSDDGETLEYDDKEKDDYDDEEDEDEDSEMEDGDELETVMERVQNLASRLEDVEDAVSQAMTADDVDAELEDAAGNKLADAETVKTLTEAKEELEERVKELESRPAESKTLTDSREGEEFDWSSADDGIDYDPATGSMSR